MGLSVCLTVCGTGRLSRIVVVTAEKSIWGNNLCVFVFIVGGVNFLRERTYEKIQFLRTGIPSIR